MNLEPKQIEGTAEELGLRPNAHMWISDGFDYCKGCKRYTYHDAYSKSDAPQSCYEVCRECKKYYGGEYGH